MPQPHETQENFAPKPAGIFKGSMAFPAPGGEKNATQTYKHTVLTLSYHEHARRIDPRTRVAAPLPNGQAEYSYLTFDFCPN